MHARTHSALWPRGEASGQRREISKGQKDSKAPADRSERIPRLVAVVVVIVVSYRGEARARFYFPAICLRCRPQFFRPLPRSLSTSGGLCIFVLAQKEIEMQRRLRGRRARARARSSLLTVDLINEETPPGRDISLPPLSSRWKLTGERGVSAARTRLRYRKTVTNYRYVCAPSQYYDLFSKRELSAPHLSLYLLFLSSSSTAKRQSLSQNEKADPFLGAG